MHVPTVDRLARELFPGLPPGRALIAARALLDLTEAVDPRA